MDSEAKSIHQGTTYINTPPQGNPPPYSGSAQQVYPPLNPEYPAPGYPGQGPQYPPQGPQYPPQGMQYGHPQPVRTAVVLGPTVVVAQQLGPKPTHINCKSCHADIVTRIESNASTRTHLFALVLCLIGCWPCACIPYCMDECMNANHYCPNCNAYLGSYVN